MSETGRLFIAVPVPDAVRARVQQVQDRFKEAGVRASWVRPDAMHITLLFLGDTPLDRLPDLEKALTEAARTSPFQVRVQGAGAFPNPARARVVWLGLHDEGHLSALAQALRAALPSDGSLTWDPKPFRPHLTLARLRAPSPAIPQALGALADAEGVSFPVDRVVLYQSVLAPEGASHTALAWRPLSGMDS